jgi:DNA invertase Pin-like site-specific DNA recombinase
MRYGYVRVSTLQQETALQYAALQGASVDVFFVEKLSGVGFRPELERLLSVLVAGDELCVYKIDRLGRSFGHLWELFDRFEKRGICFRSLTEPIDFRSASGRLVVGMFALLAEFERGLIRERCEAGRREAMMRGVRFGVPPRVSRERVLALKAEKKTHRQIALAMGCCITTVKKIVRGQRVCDRLLSVAHVT